eukprot:2353343-Prorocentrum_lima.AAC.1
MTSSLVGSEMCIRDRINVVHGHLGGVSGTNPPTWAMETTSYFDDALRACLLYTSDAADDM